jgi:hypothetical protein
VSIYPVSDPLSLEGELSSGESYVAAFAVAWASPDGTSVVAGAPISLVVDDGAIVAGDLIEEVGVAGLQTVGSASSNGAATVVFTSDPTFVVASPAKPVVAVTSGRLAVEGGAVSVKVTCRVATCAGVARLTQVISVATKRGKSPKSETLLLAERSYRLAASKSETLRLVLNATGARQLLRAAVHAVATKVAVSVSGGSTVTHSISVN